MLTIEENKIKDFLFDELMKQTGFNRLSMDSQGEMVNEFVRTVSALRSVPITWDEEKTLHDCPTCTGTGEAQSGVGSCSACRGKGTIDDRPHDY
jgi:DnaJ-class molecular chaperone